jgi:hypothetical protein
LRSFFEKWMKANEGLGDSKKLGLKHIWSLVCLEVLLRICRDVVFERVHHVQTGELMEAERVLEINRALNNLKINWSPFWEPLGVADWHEVEVMDCEHYVQHCLQDQLLERRDELIQYADQNLAVKEHLFEGMPDLVLSFVKGGGSSDGSSKK